MTQQEVGANFAPGLGAPANIHVNQPMAPGSQGQPLGVAVHATPAVAQQNQMLLVPSAMQNPQVMFQQPAAMPHLQIPAGVGQCLPGPPNFQTLSGPPPHPQEYNSSQFQWNIPFPSLSSFDPKKFLKKENRTLGAIQILIGLTHVICAFNPWLYRHPVSVTGVSGYPIWGGICYIISGTLSVWAEKDPSPCMVNGSIRSNVVSAIFSLTGICILILDICISWDFTKAISGCLLPFAILEFCLTCVVSHFGCQAVCWNHFWNFTATPAPFHANPATMATGPINTTIGMADVNPGPAGVATGPICVTTATQACLPTTPANLDHPSNTSLSGHPEPTYEDVGDMCRKQ